jgi:hypothetical protein
MEIPEKLLKLFDERKVILFIGSGCSHFACSTMPDWLELTKSFAVEMPDINFDENRTDDYPKVIQVYEKRFGRNELCDKLKQLLNTSGVDIFNSELHIALLELPCLSFYTTNLDDLMEKSFESVNRPCQKIVTVEDIAGIDCGHAQIFKFHGDLTNCKSLVVTEADFHRRLEFNDPLDINLKADALGKSLLFIGYRFADPNVRYLWHTLNQIGVGKEDMPPSYIVLLQSNTLEKETLESYGIKVIDLGVRDTKHPYELVEFLQELVKNTFRRHYKKVDREFFRKRHPRRILTPLIFNNLKDFIKNDKVSTMDKIGKLKETLDSCFVPQKLWDDFLVWVKEVTTSSCPPGIKTNLAISINHIANPLFVVPFIDLLFTIDLPIENRNTIAFPIVGLTYPDKDQKVANNIAEYILKKLEENMKNDLFLKSGSAGFIFHLLQNFRKCRIFVNPNDEEKKIIRAIFEKYGKFDHGMDSLRKSLFSSRSAREIFKNMSEKLPKSRDV